MFDKVTDKQIVNLRSAKFWLPQYGGVKNTKKDYIKYTHDGASISDIETEFDNLSTSNQNNYAKNVNKRAGMVGSDWESITSEMDDLIFLEHGYQVKSLDPESADQITFGDIFRPVFDHKD